MARKRTRTVTVCGVAGVVFPTWTAAQLVGLRSSESPTLGYSLTSAARAASRSIDGDEEGRHGDIDMAEAPACSAWLVQTSETVTRMQTRPGSAPYWSDSLVLAAITGKCVNSHSVGGTLLEALWLRPVGRVQIKSLAPSFRSADIRHEGIAILHEVGGTGWLVCRRRTVCMTDVFHDPGT
jgi:hypothetical protein